MLNTHTINIYRILNPKVLLDLFKKTTPNKSFFYLLGVVFEVPSGYKLYPCNQYIISKIYVFGICHW